MNYYIVSDLCRFMSVRERLGWFQHWTYVTQAENSHSTRFYRDMIDQIGRCWLNPESNQWSIFTTDLTWEPSYIVTLSQSEFKIIQKVIKRLKYKPIFN